MYQGEVFFVNNKIKEFIFCSLTAIFILAVFFFISLIIHIYLNTQILIAPLFILAVFLIALCTSGYFYGIFSALLSVLAVNFAFTFPYFAFNFTLQENIFSAIILISVTVITSTLTTKIKEQEKVKLQAETEKMKANLLRALSHDLRTPLTSIYGASSTVVENYNILSSEDKLDIISGIQKDSKWLIRMVENLLSITRIDNSNATVIKHSVVLEELVDSALNKFKKNYPDKKVLLSIPDEFIIVSADPLLIEQVLLNLLENAVQHAKGMTELKLNIVKQDLQVVFEVIDNGCGMEKEKLKNIFTGYYSEDNSLSDNQKRCMGIGLSVCATIIRAHGGEISAENLKRGGMVFKFTLMAEETCDE